MAENFAIKNGVLLLYFGDDQNIVIPDGVTKIEKMLSRVMHTYKQLLCRTVLSKSAQEHFAIVWVCKRSNCLRISKKYPVLFLRAARHLRK